MFSIRGCQDEYFEASRGFDAHDEYNCVATDDPHYQVMLGHSPFHALVLYAACWQTVMWLFLCSDGF